MTTLIDFLTKLKTTGLSINTIYDIGACNGVWSQEIKGNVFPNSEFIMFEANAAHTNQLRNTGLKYFQSILSNPGREYVEFYTRNGTGDSYYKENSTHYDHITSTQLPCTTLDKIIAEHNLPKPDFIKLDTQGSELDILAGAESVIDTTKLIYTECPITQYNIGSPNINDYLEYFKSKDFLPIDILEIHKAEELLIQVDIMFMKKEYKEQIFGKSITHRL
jgi:FkbM family methyltransferase